MELLIDTATTNAWLCDGSCRTEVSAQMIPRPIGKSSGVTSSPLWHFVQSGLARQARYVTMPTLLPGIA